MEDKDPLNLLYGEHRGYWRAGDVGFQSRLIHGLNILRPRQIATISQTTFSNAFCWMKMYELR